MTLARKIVDRYSCWVMLGASALILDFGVVDDSDMLHALELCAGDACLSASYDAFDMRAHGRSWIASNSTFLVTNLARQVRYSRHYDVLKMVGFYAMLEGLRRVCVSRLNLYTMYSLFCEVHGHLWIGCPCSSWIWVSRSSTRRCRLRPKGSKKFKGVRKANCLARRFCFAPLG